MPRLRLDPTSPSGVSIAPDEPSMGQLRRQNNGYVVNKATGLIKAGSNVTLGGSGTQSDPYVINSSGTGGGGTTLPADATGWLHDNGTGTLAWTTPAKSDVGLSNVDNTSDITKNSAVAALTNKDLTSNTNTFPTFNQNTTGTAGNVTGTVAIANGGTGQTTQQTALNALAGTQSAGKYLRSDGTNTSLAAIQATDVPTLNQNTTGSAAKLTTARNIQANLASTSAVAFDGSAAITPGVTGTLPVGNGGTGATTLTGLIKGNGTGAMTAATSGTDYARPMAINVKDYGAKGDGTTDDTTAIQNALTAAYNQTNGGAVYIPAGTYIVSSQLNIVKNTSKSTLLFGDGMQATIIKFASASTGQMFYAGSSTVTGGGCNIYVQDIGLLATNNTNQKGFYLENANIMKLTRVAFTSFQIGAELKSSYAVQFNQCIFSSDATYDIVCDTTAHGLRVFQCGFYSSGGTTGQCIRFTGTSASNNITIDQSDFETYNTLLQADGGLTSLTFTNNYCEYGSNAFFYSAVQSYGCIFEGNWLSYGSVSITLDKMTGGRFAHNTLYNETVTLGSGLSQFEIGPNVIQGTSSLPTYTTDANTWRVETHGKNTTYFISGVSSYTQGANSWSTQNLTPLPVALGTSMPGNAYLTASGIFGDAALSCNIGANGAYISATIKNQYSASITANLTWALRIEVLG